MTEQRISKRGRVNEGGPSKYHPKYCKMLIDFMGKGYSIEAFAGHIGVVKETIYGWSRKHPEFLDAKIEAFGKNLVFWEKLGIKGATGSEKFNVRAWTFNMKNRHGWREMVDVHQRVVPPIVVETDDGETKYERPES